MYDRHIPDQKIVPKEPSVAIALRGLPGAFCVPGSTVGLRCLDGHNMLASSFDDMLYARKDEKGIEGGRT